jgi:hypothetical protein
MYSKQLNYKGSGAMTKFQIIKQVTAGTELLSADTGIY